MTKTSLAIFVFAIAILILVAGEVSGDGRVTQPTLADPVTMWRIAELKFPLLSAKSAIVQVAYIRGSGAIDHVAEHTFSGDDYESFLGALSTPAGEAEQNCVLRDAEGNPVVGVGGSYVPSRACIFNLRLSHWMVEQGKIEGVTAETLDTTPPTP